MTLIDILRRERGVFALLAGEYERQARQAYYFWEQGGRQDEKMLASFLTAHHRSEEMHDRVNWITKVIDEYVAGFGS